MLKFSTRRHHFAHYSLIQRDKDLFYIVGGNGNGSDSTKIIKWDAEVWSHVGDLQHRRHLAVLAMNGNQLLIIAGVSATFTDTQAT